MGRQVVAQLACDLRVQGGFLDIAECADLDLTRRLAASADIDEDLHVVARRTAAEGDPDHLQRGGDGSRGLSCDPGDGVHVQRHLFVHLTVHVSSGTSPWYDVSVNTYSRAGLHACHTCYGIITSCPETSSGPFATDPAQSRPPGVAAGLH